MKTHTGTWVARRRGGIYELLDQTERKQTSEEMKSVQSVVTKIIHSARPTTAEESARVLHRTWGHRSTGNILQAIRKGIIKHEKIEKLGQKEFTELLRAAKQMQCAGCSLGKTKRIPARRTHNREKQQVGRTFYLDYCGPVKPPVPLTFQGKRTTETGFNALMEGNSKYMFTDGVPSKAHCGVAAFEVLELIAKALPRKPDHVTKRQIVTFLPSGISRT
jgi:hypothetical protein